MTLDQAFEIIQAMKARAPGSAEFGVRMVNGEICQLNPNSFAVIGENSDVSIDASGHWAGNVGEANAVYMKQA